MIDLIFQSIHTFSHMRDMKGGTVHILKLRLKKALVSNLSFILTTSVNEIKHASHDQFMRGHNVLHVDTMTI